MAWSHQQVPGTSLQLKVPFEFNLCFGIQTVKPQPSAWQAGAIIIWNHFNRQKFRRHYVRKRNPWRKSWSRLKDHFTQHATRLPFRQPTIRSEIIFHAIISCFSLLTLLYVPSHHLIVLLSNTKFWSWVSTYVVCERLSVMHEPAEVVENLVQILQNTPILKFRIPPPENWNLGRSWHFEYFQFQNTPLPPKIEI